jgi:hypothetical protein
MDDCDSDSLRHFSNELLKCCSHGSLDRLKKHLHVSIEQTFPTPDRPDRRSVRFLVNNTITEILTRGSASADTVARSTRPDAAGSAQFHPGRRPPAATGTAPYRTASSSNSTCLYIGGPSAPQNDCAAADSPAVDGRRCESRG